MTILSLVVAAAVILPVMAQDSAADLPDPVFQVQSRLSTDSPRADGRPFAEHTVDLSEDQRVVITSSSDDFDPILEVYDRDGTELLARDDDGGEGLNSRLAFTPHTSGPYKLRVLSYSDDGDGEYQLVVAPGPRLPVPVEFPSEHSIMSWSAVEGHFTPSETSESPQVTGRFVDHRLTLSSDEEIIVRASSQAISLFVEFFAAERRDGFPLDGFGGDEGEEAVAVFRAPAAGDYVVRVRPLWSEGGSYRLSVGRYASVDE